MDIQSKMEQGKNVNQNNSNSRPNKHLSQRKSPLQLVVLRWIFRNIGALFPTFIGYFAYKLWFGTRRFPTPKREQSWIKSAKSEAIDINGLPVMTHYWENSQQEKAPLVLLVHGWDGRGSQMGAFAEPLLQAGFSVLAYDNPAHGQTPGKGSNLFIHSEVQQALIDKIGPVYAIVAHSFGGMFSAYSLSHNLISEKVVIISPPADFMSLLDRFGTELQLPSKVRENLIQRFKKQFGDDLVQRVSATTTSQQLGHIPALIIHDVDDQDVPFSEGEKFHQSWPNSLFQRSQGLGHRRILYNPEVIQNTVDFLK